MAATHNLSDLVRAVFQAWKTVKVDFLILRNYETLPDSTTNDIDVLVSPKQLRLAEKELVAAARSVGFVLHNRAEFSPVSLFFYHPESCHQIQFDLFAVLRWRGLTLLSTERALSQKIERGNFAIPHPAHEAVLNLITRLLYQKRVKETYRPKIREVFQAQPQEARALLCDTFGKSLGQTLFDYAKEAEWESIESRASQYRRTLLIREFTRHPLRTVCAFVSDIFRLGRRFLRPPGLAIVLLGPDGCGKSSVLPKVTEELSRSFSLDKGLQVHWKPIVFFSKRRRDRPPTTSPHARPPRNVVMSLVFLSYHWLEFFLGYWLQIMPVRFRNGLVMMDRHYYDFRIDPKRYRLKPPASAVRLGQFLLPKPDLVFLLDAPPEILQMRKQEVPFQETARQREDFLSLIRPLSNGRIIDATRPIDEATSNVVRSVLEFCTERMERQKGSGYG